WSSDVCSSDLRQTGHGAFLAPSPHCSCSVGSTDSVGQTLGQSSFLGNGGGEDGPLPLVRTTQARPYARRVSLLGTAKGAMQTRPFLRAPSRGRCLRHGCIRLASSGQRSLLSLHRPEQPDATSVPFDFAHPCFQQERERLWSSPFLSDERSHFSLQFQTHECVLCCFL